MPYRNVTDAANATFELIPAATGGNNIWSIDISSEVAETYIIKDGTTELFRVAFGGKGSYVREFGNEAVVATPGNAINVTKKSGTAANECTILVNYTVGRRTLGS